MRLAVLLIASLLIAVAPTSVGTRGAMDDDPLNEARQAVEQGRHWHATRLLRDLARTSEVGPEATLLAARADAGRGAWDDVARRLEGQPWLDSLAFGEGRALLARARLERGDNLGAVVAFEAFLDYAIERRPRVLAELGLARALERLDQGPEAAAAYQRAALAMPSLRPWTAIRAAEELAQTGDTVAVRAALVDVDYSHRRRMTEVEAYQQAGNSHAALDLLLDAADTPSGSRRRGELHARAARIQLDWGDTTAAIGTLRGAIRVAPSYSREAAELLAELPERSAADYLAIARALDRSGAPAPAARAYQRYLTMSSPAAQERVRLQLKIGELQFRAGQYWLAIEGLERLIASKPGTATESRAAYLRARATYRRGWRREGRARLREVASRYPGTSSALRSLTLLADLYDNAGDYARARTIYDELVRDYPTSRSARTARFRLGIFDYLDGDHAAARRHFERARRLQSRGQIHVAASYWAARSALTLDDPGLADDAEQLLRHVHARDPYGYYGFLAAARVGIDPWETLEDGPEPEAVDAVKIARLDLIGLLREAGLYQEAQAVLESVLEEAPQRPAALLGLSNALAARGFGQEAVRLGWRAHARLRGHWSATVLKAIYPLAFEEIILAEARAQDLPPYLVAAIARQESAFAPQVVSRAGARGLLQIMPETGRWWASRMGIRDYNRDALFHPEINVHLGTAYFADLNRRYGDLQLSLIAYNAGPTRARRWRQRPSYAIDPELFVEQIPFNETRTYVRNIQTQVRIYRHLYGHLAIAEPAD